MFYTPDYKRHPDAIRADVRAHPDEYLEYAYIIADEVERMEANGWVSTPPEQDHMPWPAKVFFVVLVAGMSYFLEAPVRSTQEKSFGTELFDALLKLASMSLYCAACGAALCAIVMLIMICLSWHALPETLTSQSLDTIPEEHPHNS
jgi:hypothetical protein